MDVAEKILRGKADFDAVYDAGYAKGQAQGGGGGYDEGFEAGKQAQEDAFWDAHQQNGTRTDYQGAFGGVGWTNEFFKPKYDMSPTAAAYMFRRTSISGDLVEILDNFGVTLDFSNCTNMMELFSNAPNITRVGVIDIRKARNAITNVFAYCGVKTIDKIIIDETNDTSYFPGAATELENVVIEGTIARTSPYWQYSTKLSKASIDSIVNALSDTTSGLSITLSKTAVDAISAAEAEDYGDYLSSLKPNWTINLV
jgi:hypothetical protein